MMLYLEQIEPVSSSSLFVTICFQKYKETPANIVMADAAAVCYKIMTSSILFNIMAASENIRQAYVT